MDGAAQLGVALTPAQLAAFGVYTAVLNEWSPRFNLTRVSGPEEIVRIHFLDSLACLAADPFPQGARLLDVGSGAGFPGVPLKIARPDFQLTLLEARRRRAAFLDLLVAKLALAVEVVHGRAEILGHQSGWRERYDRVVSRATASLPLLFELCMPFVRVGGRVILPKGPHAREEVVPSRRALEHLGGEVVAVCTVSPGPGMKARNIVVVQKVRPTPDHLPRRLGIARKRPLLR